jgi:hypothetical protein
MLVFGRNGKGLITALAKGVKCGNCGNVDTTLFAVIGNYAHLYHIPVFPIGKSGNTYCTHCKYVCSEKDLSSDLKERFKVLKKSTSYPIWLKSLLDEPPIGMRIAMKLGSDSYMTAKLKEIKEDTLIFALNKFSSNKRYIPDEVDKPDNYTSLEVAMTKSEYKEKFNAKEITEVKR